MSVFNENPLDSSSCSEDSFLQESVSNNSSCKELNPSGFKLKEIVKTKQQMKTGNLGKNISLIDSEFHPKTKSTQVLITKSQIEFREKIVKYEEEIRLTLEVNSDFIYYESLNCYCRKDDENYISTEQASGRKQLKYNSTKQPNNTLFKNRSDYNSEVMSVNSRVKFSCTNTVFEFDCEDSSSEDDKDIATLSTNSGYDTIIEEDCAEEKDFK